MGKYIWCRAREQRVPLSRCKKCAELPDCVEALSAVEDDKWLRQGVHRISLEDYIKDPCPEPSLTRGTIKSLCFETPYHAWWGHPRLNPAHVNANHSKYDIGSACHSLFLEGIDKACVIQADDWRTKAAREQRDAAYGSGKIPLLEHQYHEVTRIVQATQKMLAESELSIANVQTAGHSELTYIWQEDGIWCKVRPDWISNDRTIILDCKFTTLSASPGVFVRQIDTLGYDIQHAFYRRGVKVVDKIDAQFFFLVMEISPPYFGCLIGLAPQYIDLGEQKVERGMALWRKHLSENDWPGYSKRIHYVEPKAWAVAQWEERQFTDELAEQGEKNNGSIPF